jgi:hypothetical protein
MSFRISLLALLFMALGFANASVAGLDVRVENERVFIEADQQSLSVVLHRVASMTGVAMQVSPAVERLISLSVKGRTVQQTMNQIARQEQLSVVLGWQRLADGQSRLVSVDVLPEGDMDHSSLDAEYKAQRRTLNQQSNKAKAILKREQKREERELRAQKKRSSALH